MRIGTTGWMGALALAGVLLGLALPAQALEITVTTGRDNTLYSPNGDRSNGGGQYIFAGRNGLNRTLRSVIQFDLAGLLPEEAVVEQARLVLSNTTPRPRDAATATLHRLQQAFGEGTSVGTRGEGTGNTPTPGDATWLDAIVGTSTWNTPGGDFDLTPLATSAAGTIEFSSASLVEDVQRALDDPSQHFGWLLKLSDENLKAYRYGSFQSNRGPELVIDYRLVPEPGTATLLALGLLGMAVRRRV